MGENTGAATIGIVWTRDRQLVSRYLTRRCGDRELAEDIVAETFLHATIAVRKGQEVTTPWLLTVAKRRLMDHWRSKHRELRLHERIVHEERCKPTARTIDVGGGELEQALDRLSEKQRSALTLRYLRDYSVDQVAQSLGLTYPAAESLLARSRRRLAGEYRVVTAVAG